MVDSVYIEEFPVIRTKNVLSFTLSGVKEIIFYPFTMCNKLVQMGYIPKELYVEKTELDHKIYEIPSEISILQKIFHDEGIGGFSRGICSNFICFVIYESVLFIGPYYFQKFYRQYFEDVQINSYLYRILKICGVHAAAVILSQPFLVLSNIQAGQFIGKETIYSGYLISPFIRLGIHKGITAYFSGLTPRLMKIVIIQILVDAVVIGMALFLGDSKISFVNNAQQQSELHSNIIRYKRLIILLAKLIAMGVLTRIAAPVDVLQTNYTVMRTGIKAGEEPFKFIDEQYSWFDNIWQKSPQLQRGVSLFTNQYLTNSNIFVPY